MSSVENYPPRYYQYLATQRRVSDWVQNTPPGPIMSRKKRHASQISDHAGGGTISPSVWHPRHRRSARRKLTSASESRLPYRGPESTEKFTIPPSIALLSSSLFICALLPSILTISGFVVLLTLSTLDPGNKERSTHEFKASDSHRNIREGPVEPFSS